MNNITHIENIFMSHKTLATDHAQTMINGPCIPAQVIGKKMIKDPSQVNIYWYINETGNIHDIYSTIQDLYNKDPEWSLHIFYKLSPEIQECLAQNKIIEANDKHHVHLCRLFAHIALEKIKKWMTKNKANPYQKDYRFTVNEEAYFLLSLTPTSDWPWRKMSTKNRACLILQHYSVFDNLKIKSKWNHLIDTFTMKKLRKKIRNHIHNGFTSCPFSWKNIAVYPYEMPNIPLEAAEMSITNKQEHIPNISDNITSILYTRPMFKQIPWDPNLVNMSYEDLEKVSLHEFQKIYAL